MTRFRPLKSSLLVLAVLSLTGGMATAAKDPFKKPREAFKEAYAEASTQPADEQRDSEALKGYPLYPYLQAARIKRALTEATNELGPWAAMCAVPG
jgi:soluble lytic murein transglycosylase